MTIIPIHKAPNKKRAQEIIRELAASGKVRLNTHSFKRGRQRKISMPQILNCLSIGYVVEEPVQSLTYKGWETAVVGTVAGETIKVAVCLRWSQDMVVITCYYL
jgi:hypothetical protein